MADVSSREKLDRLLPTSTPYTTASQRLAVSSTDSADSQLAVSMPSLNTITSERPTSDSPIIMAAKLASTSDV